jgi:hypothetical protein
MKPSPDDSYAAKTADGIVNNQVTICNSYPFWIDIGEAATSYSAALNTARRRLKIFPPPKHPRDTLI